MSGDPMRGLPFRLRMGGAEVAGFSEAEGMGGEPEAIDLREGGAAAAVRHLPGAARPRPVTLKRGMATGDALSRWFMASAAGEVEPRDVEIVLDLGDGDASATWRLGSAWVSAMRGGAMDRETGQTALESVTLAYDRIERA